MNKWGLEPGSYGSFASVLIIGIKHGRALSNSQGTWVVTGLVTSQEQSPPGKGNKYMDDPTGEKDEESLNSSGWEAIQLSGMKLGHR